MTGRDPPKEVSALAVLVAVDAPIRIAQGAPFPHAVGRVGAGEARIGGLEDQPAVVVNVINAPPPPSLSLA
jgi:hypothetical protein